MSPSYSYSYSWDGLGNRRSFGDWIVCGEGPPAYSVQAETPAVPASPDRAARSASPERAEHDAPEGGANSAAWGLAYRNVFSDLGQWMGKVLLGQGLPESVVHLPRGPIRNAHQLALAAQVSDASANRWVRAMEGMHFLRRSRSELALLRPGDFLERWQNAVRARPVLEIRAVFEWPSERPGEELHECLRACKLAKRYALGLYAACDALGLGIVRGVSPHLYVEDLSPHDLDALGLRPSMPGEPAHVFLRRPSAPESLFRGAVWVEGLWVADALQCWLDLRDHPARGKEQAAFLAERLRLPCVES